MFDIGGLELLVIGVVALIVVGPKDLPGMFRTVGRFVGKARGMARDFQRAMEQAADESGVREATKGLKDIEKFDVTSPTKAAKSFAKAAAKEPVRAPDPAPAVSTAAVRDPTAPEPESAPGPERPTLQG